MVIHPAIRAILDADPDAVREALALLGESEQKRLAAFVSRLHCAGCDQLRRELYHSDQHAAQYERDAESRLSAMRAELVAAQQEIQRTDGQLRSLMGAALKDSDVITQLQAELARVQLDASAKATGLIAELEKLRAAVREHFGAFSEEAAVKMYDLVWPLARPEQSCEFCMLGDHHVSECGLLKHMRGVRFDEQTRQVLWQICERHDHWSTNSHTECGLCNLEAGQHGK